MHRLKYPPPTTTATHVFRQTDSLVHRNRLGIYLMHTWYSQDDFSRTSIERVWKIPSKWKNGDIYPEITPSTDGLITLKVPPPILPRLMSGVWITPPNVVKPVVTLIGSSNFTRRSDQLDLESTCVVVTRDPQLQSSLADEIQHLRKFTKETSVEELNGMLAEGGWRRGIAVRAWVAMVAGML